MKSDRDVYLEIGTDLMRFATALVGPNDAPDLVSTVVTRVLARRRLTDLDEPKRYLMQAVANEAKNVRRHRSRRRSALARLGDPGHAPDAGEGRYPDLTAAVMRLPSKQRAAIYLVYWVGMAPSEAAAQMGCRPATLRRYLSLARAKLRRFVDAR